MRGRACCDAAHAAAVRRQSIVDPSTDIPEDYRGVSIVTLDGKHITGVRVNEDTFSIQLRLQNDKFALYRKSNLRSVEGEKTSLMPAYQKLAPNDLQDLRSYLDTLRGSVASTLNVLLKFLKRRTDLPRNGAAPKFDGNNGRRSLDEADDHDADNVVERMFFSCGLGHVGGNRSPKSATKQ